MIVDHLVMEAGIADAVLTSLKDAGFTLEIYDEPQPEPTTESIIAPGELIRKCQAEIVVAVGGGSTIDTAKAVAIVGKLGGTVQEYAGVEQVPGPVIPLVALPTTSGTGSEVSPGCVLVDTSLGAKINCMSKHLIPRVALVDPVLTMSAPGKVAASAGFDALAHAVESYTSLRANPLTELFSLEAIRLVGKALRAAVNDRSDLGANSEMALASLYAGIGMANAGTCAAHALAYPLGTRFHVPHGVSVAMVLASAVAYNAPASVAKHARVAEALGVITRGLSAKEAAEAASSACRQLANDIGLPTTMREFGLVEEEIERLAEEAMSITRLVINNPRPLSASHAASIYRSML